MEDRHFSRPLSKPAPAAADASFRLLYYGGAAGAVPFLWESRPGTPKHPSACQNSLPPLTPPPSYQSPNLKPVKKHSRSNSRIFRSILSISKAVTPSNARDPPAAAIWPYCSSSSSSSTSSFSSSYSAPPTPVKSSALEEMMCFRYGGTARVSMRRVKKAVLAIVGH